MTLLSTGKLGKYFGERKLFADVSLEVGDRDKVGLVGANGCGKSTLFKIITGEERADEGTVALSHNARVGYMEQYVGRDGGRTLWEEAVSVFQPVMDMEAELEDIHLQLECGDNSPALLERQSALRERFEETGGLYYRNRVRAALLGLGFSEDAFSQRMDTLSGGQRSKVALARLLLSDVNLLLLDEPTNHLDIASVEWLEEYLRAYTGAFIVISHDRYFLDRVTDRTFELSHGRLYSTNGNYSAHRERRAKDQEIAEKHHKTEMAEIKRIEEAIARFKQFNREKSIRQAESKEKQVERLREQVTEVEATDKTIRFAFTAETTSGNEVLNVERLRMGFGDRELFRDVTFQIRRKDRAFMLGPNGCGKSTLLKILNHELEPWFGSVREGAKVSVGYYDQTQAGLDDRKTVLEELWSAYPTMTETALRSALAAFLFFGEDVFRQVAVLSGGERARLLLLKLMLRRDNFLLLDEPTNHLDIVSCEALEEALSGYDGTMLIVSHDRYFINRMANRIIGLQPVGCQLVEGDYDAFAEKQRTATAPSIAKAAPKTNLYKERKEQASLLRKTETRIRKVEEAIAESEQMAAALQQKLDSGELSADYAALLEVTANLDKETEKQVDLLEEWEELHTALETLKKS
ncbi:MAG: ABC-F family ATP-binding cassette domain-containing protein [Clostridia bacterium]|nr:ABC-F family ATP-binding cassette domain-containing protein [Clostridia bacterium]